MKLMKTNIFSLFLAVIACVGLASCHDDHWGPYGPGAEGSVSFSSMSVDVDDAETEVSRAGVSVDTFNVVITDRKTGKVHGKYEYVDMPEVVTLPVGDYTVSVKSCDKQPDATFDAPYYVGSADFSIEAGKITEIGCILCKFMSIKVTIKYTKELAAKLGSDAHVKVVANENGTLDFAYNETRSGYFEAVEGSPTLVAEFFATINGNDVYCIKSFTNVAAGQHYIITFSIKNGSSTIPDEFGQISQSGISIDADIEHQDVGSNTQITDPSGSGSTQRPGEEEWPDDPTPPGPGPDQPGEDPIKLVTDLNVAPQTNPVEAGKEYVVNISATHRVENLIVKIETTNEEFRETVENMRITEFDMAHLDASLKETLTTVGLEGLDAIYGETSVPFDLSGLIPLLVSFEGTHTFTIEVTDQATPANTKSLSLIFIAE